MPTFSPTVKVSAINAKASDYDLFSDAWTTFADLSQGGALLREAVIKRGQYLWKKPKELAEVFATRQSRFSYTNLLGNIIGWYMAALFKLAPQLVLKVAGKEGDEATKIPQDAADFCAQFEKDADRAGCGFADFFPQVFESLALHKSAYVLIDLPAPDGDDPPPLNLKQQQDAGLLNPFLVCYTPSQVINWETDRYGNLEWCVIHVTAEEREFLSGTKLADYWYYFDRTEVAMYRADRDDNGRLRDDSDARLVEGYPRPHAMAELGRIPVRKISVKDGLWLANRVYLPLLNHLNLDNAYDFGLFQSALAQLVVKGEFNDNLTLSEVGYVKIDQEGDIFYLEPEGKAFEAIDKRLEILEERIYKACYLQDQGRSSKATPAMQSGYSKSLDKMPSRDALSGFGDVIRPAMQAVYADVLAVRGFTEIVPDVRGFDFSDKAGADEMDFMERSTVIDVQSDLYRRERDKKFVRIVLSDANPETLHKIDDEIDTNPTPEGAAQQQAEQARAAQVDKFAASLKAGAQLSE